MTAPIYLRRHGQPSLTSRICDLLMMYRGGQRFTADEVATYLSYDNVATVRRTLIRLEANGYVDQERVYMNSDRWPLSAYKWRHDAPDPFDRTA